MLKVSSVLIWLFPDDIFSKKVCDPNQEMFKLDPITVDGTHLRAWKWVLWASWGAGKLKPRKIKQGPVAKLEKRLVITMERWVG